ncbi:cytochrome d ubiquinol oxidase subunit II [candidate division KSB1 bacterium]|nr:cytochrome d ubiquinol oxidase subunit II [candidate division KSB1 bacterium]
MDLNTLWFALITVLFIGFFILEGFDYGVGVLHLFMAKDDARRRVTLNAIGTFWDGNEVWVLTAGGAIFAAFPHWYATLFSGFYLALVLLLLALIVRGVSFEFRSKDSHPAWRSLWDWLFFLGSAIPAFLWGVAVANLIRGVPIDANMNYVGGFFNLLNPYALLGGLMTLSLFTYHGAIFLALKTTDDILATAQSIARRLWLPTTILVFAFVFGGYIATDMFTRLGVNPGIAPIIAGIALLLSGWFVREKKFGFAFLMTGITLAASVSTVFIGLFPRLMVSSLNEEWSLTIYNAASSPYTLKIMSIIALIFLPIVLAYQAWSYWVFRKRVSVNSRLEY